MSEEIKSLLKCYKSGQITCDQLKLKLNHLLETSADKIQSKTLLALLFNEIYLENNLQEENQFLVIVNGIVQNPGCEQKKENMLVYKDEIIATSSNFPDTLPDDADGLYVIDAKNLIITPGLIDQHIHGGYGCNFNTSPIEEIVSFLNELPKHGVTSLVPTVMTAPILDIKEQISKIKESKKKLLSTSTKILGVHLEGPYLCQSYKGIQPEYDIISPNIESFKQIEDPEIKIVSYSPELDGNFSFIKYLKEKNIIPSAGHTNATFCEIRNAEKNGLKQITHLFNAMVPLHHRNPGIIGEALTNDNLYVEVIPDGLHVHPVVLDIITRAKPDSKIIFISDSLPLTEAKTESIVFGNQEIFKKDNKAVNDAGTLAGSMIFLDAALRNVLKWDFIDFSTGLKFVTSNVAENLGENKLGYLDKGMKADIVIWENSGELQVNTTIINGKIAFKR